MNGITRSQRRREANARVAPFARLAHRVDAVEECAVPVAGAVALLLAIVEREAGEGGVREGVRMVGGDLREGRGVALDGGGNAEGGGEVGQHDAHLAGDALRGARARLRLRREAEALGVRGAESGGREGGDVQAAAHGGARGRGGARVQRQPPGRGARIGGIGGAGRLEAVREDGEERERGGVFQKGGLEGAAAGCVGGGSCDSVKCGG